MTVIYEVTLEIHPDRICEFEEFMGPHIAEMYGALNGITSHCFARCELICEDGWVQYTAAYRVATRADLQDYLDNRAAKLREPLFELLGGQFRAHRRILQVVSASAKQT